MLTSPEFKLNQIMRAHEAQVDFKMKGRYQLTVHRNGEIVQQTPWFDNLILNQGLDYIGQYNNGTLTGTGPFDYAQVGTGTSTPAATQTQLDSFVASKTVNGASTFTNSGAPNYISTVVWNYTFVQGAVVGNMSEVGVGRLATTGGLFSRSRILDSSLNPTTITLTSIDQLTVSYALSIVPSLANVSSSVTLEGIAYPYTVYTTYASSGTGANVGAPYIGLPWFAPTMTTNATQGDVYGAGTPLSPTVLTDASVPGATSQANLSKDANSTYSYTVGTYTGIYTLSIGPSVGNLSGGIQCLRVQINIGQCPFYVLYYFTTPIPKINTKRLNLVMTCSWSNA